MSVLRSADSSEITHISIHYANKKQYYLSKRDYDTFLYHKVTSKQINAFMKANDFKKEYALMRIANGTLRETVFRFDVMVHAGLFKDEVLKK